ncbi:VC2046/SO_2500 family protein [Idiomarina xiamenensis]|uniref:Uncharacterized protein n=1 Tax=Idiomarina xiamenensis 10-D-4 TaxID=740709 RepID=K2JMT0_9GAMM|nr:VC2046/SO_2500 family protein [Idiomarina xiamenensis]EKE84831.1 hypothetical protein A10D4_04435 [Idiomarina xiamenensis 10-D-4]
MALASNSPYLDNVAASPRVQQRVAQALARGDQAEFAMWLAMFSPHTDEQPQHQPLPPTNEPDWRRLLGAAEARPLDLQHQRQTVPGVYTQRAELAAFQLADALTPQALVVDASPQRLPAELVDNLDWHTRQRRQQQLASATVQGPGNERPRRYREADLYDMLQQLGIDAISSNNNAGESVA